MQMVNENTLTRQQMLKIWMIKVGFDFSELVRLSKVSKQAVSLMLNNRESIPEAFHKLCIAQGIPANLLPPATRPTADLVRENQELRARIAMLEGQGSQSSSPAHAPAS